MASFPSSEPSWQDTDLEQLSAAGDLFGVSPYVLSGIAQGESGFENKGPGINPEGYGGFFGLGENSTYTYDGSSFTDTAAELLNPSSASFEQQAEAAAAEVARELSAYGDNLYEALVTSGAFAQVDYTAAEQDLGNSSPLVGSSTSQPIVTNGEGTNATLTSATTSTAKPVAQSGIAGVLQDLDDFLNPTGGGVLSDIEDVVLLIAGRGLLTLFFLGITVGGLFLLVRKPAGAVVGAAIPATRAVQAQQRISQGAERIGNEQANIATRQAREVRMGLQNPVTG